MAAAQRYEARGGGPPVRLRAEPWHGDLSEGSVAGPAAGQYRGTDDGLLDYVAAARYLCTTPRHVRELWAKRYIAAVKVGRRVRFTRRDLDTFIATRRVEAAR